MIRNNARGVLERIQIFTQRGLLMNKKEISEIRKLLAKDNCRLDRLAGCYVNGEKEKILTMNTSFLTIPEEEMFKYCEILKKNLSGGIGKNLHNMEFPLMEETEGGHQTSLLALRDSELKNEVILEAFYDKVIGTYNCPENYLILLAHGSYDIPAKASDHEEMFDASDYVYSFVICCICPVSLSKPGLCYDPGENNFVQKIQDHMVEMPTLGFLFPAFNDRNTDIHSVLYYSKNAKLLHPEITEELLGIDVPVTAETQKFAFSAIVEDTFGQDCDFDTVRALHENLNSMIAESKDDPEPLTIDKPAMKQLLAECGADEKQLENFDLCYEEENRADQPFIAANVAAPKTFEVKSSDIMIRVPSDRTDLLETRVIDGIEYIMLPLTDDVEVNGMHIRRLT